MLVVTVSPKPLAGASGILTAPPWDARVSSRSGGQGGPAVRESHGRPGVDHAEAVVVIERVAFAVGAVHQRSRSQPLFELSFWRADAARISFTSRQVRFMLADRISATTPDTMGAAAGCR